MKQVIEVSGEGMESFLGKTIRVFCGVYIYTGRLVGVNNTFIKLEDPAIVYETGDLCAKTDKDAQMLPSPHYVQMGFIESFGPGK